MVVRWCRYFSLCVCELTLKNCIVADKRYPAQIRTPSQADMHSYIRGFIHEGDMNSSLYISFVRENILNIRFKKD